MAQAIINTAIDAFIQMDESGIILDWSPHAEAMLGWSRSEAVGASADDLIVPELQRDANNHWVSKFLYDVGSGAKGWRFVAAKGKSSMRLSGILPRSARPRSN